MTSKGASGVGDPPDYLNEWGREMWAYLVEAMGDQLRAADRPLFTMACSAFGCWEEAARDVAERGQLVKGRSKDHSADDGDEDGEERPALVKNPSVQMVTSNQNQFIAAAKELGLTPAARKRMQMELSKGKSAGPRPVID